MRITALIHALRASIREAHWALVRRIVLEVGGLLALLAVAVVHFQPPWLVALDNWFYDALIRAGTNGASAPRVVIIDIDEQSLVAVGQWPWPRYRIAALVKKLAASGPAAIGFDILFAEPDRTSLSTIKETFQKEFNLNIGFSGLPSGLDDNDGYLGHVLGQAPTVGAFFFYFDRRHEDRCPVAPLEISGPVHLLNVPEAAGVLCNTPKVQTGFTTGGFINNLKDNDGVLRRLPLIIAHQGRYYPNFSLAVFMLATGHKNIHIGRDFFGPTVRIGETSIPIDDKGNAWLRFRGPARGCRFVSAVDVLTGQFDRASLTDRLLLIGSTAVGLNDLHHTPVGPEVSGTEVHAVMLDGAFSSLFSRQPVWKNTYAQAATMLAGLAIPLIFAYAGPLLAAAGTLGVSLLFLSLSLVAFYTRGVFLPTSGAVLVSGVQFTVLSLLLYAFERRLALLRMKKLIRVQQLTLDVMAAVTETRDLESGNHIKRTQHYVRLIAEYLMNTGHYPLLTADYVELLYHCAPLHDVGKVAIPDAILFSTAKFTPEEFEIMKKHTVFGKQIIETATGGREEHDFLNLAAEIAFAHHEKWDGSGYPAGLVGEAIPLSGRIMAVADYYDALITARRYKPALSHPEARAAIESNRGTHFDPAVVDAFLALEDEFIRIAEAFQNEKEEQILNPV
ncbi:MAG: CHASE2 domain-containing protein [Thermodesulfobacteriota bacterium]